MICRSATYSLEAQELILRQAVSDSKESMPLFHRYRTKSCGGPTRAMSHLRIATRKSELAQWQARWVAGELKAQGHTVELILLTSEGDIDQRPITDSSGRGLFTKRIQEALLSGEADIAVHSLKDLPTEPTAGLQLAAVPPREEVRDCLISRNGQSLEKLPAGAVIGTGSRRRVAQLKFHRSDLNCEAIRGNVETRLRKVHEGQYDAVVLAEAGLKRLNLVAAERIPLSLEIMLPAPGQGALGIEVRTDAPEVAKAVEALNHAESFAAVTAERRLLADLQGGCLAPIAAYGRCSGMTLRLQAVVLSSDGRRRLTAQGERPLHEASELGASVARELADQGARNLITEARA